MNSKGLKASNIKPLYVLKVSINADKDGYPIYVNTDRACKNLDGFDFEELLEELRERTDSQSKPLDKFESGEYRVIFAKNFAYFLCCTAWQLFSGKKYLENATALKELFGRKISDVELNISDMKDLTYDFKIDTEGTIAQDVKLVEDGYFKNLMNNSGVSHELGATNNGCAGRKPLLFGNIATDIQIVPRNFIIENGSYAYDELLNKLNNGIVLLEHYDVFHSLDISSGNFQIPALGYMVQNGQKVGNLHALVVSGNIVDIFRNIEGLSNRMALRPMHYLDNYGIGTPDILVSRCQVAGE